MANENQNTGASNLPGGNQTSAGMNIGSKGTSDIRNALKDILEDQGDYNNLLKDSLKYLNQTDGAYKKIGARIASLNKETINVKAVQQELYKLKQKEAIALINVQDLQKEVSKEKRDELEIVKKLATTEDEIIQYLKDQGDASSIALYYAEQQLAYAQRKTEFGKQALDDEKQLAKDVGITGKLLQLSNKYLGVGGDLHEKIVEETRTGVSTTSGWAKGVGLVIVAATALDKVFTSIGSGISYLGNELKSISQDSSDVASGLTSGVSDMIKKIPIVGGLIGGVIDGFSAVLDLVLGVDNQIVQWGRTLNLSTEEARKLNRYYQDIALNSGDIFVTSRKLFETQARIADQLGVTNLLTNEILATNIRLGEIADLEEDTQRGITETAIIGNKAASSTVKSILAQVQGIKNATGIQFQNQKILKEVTNLSGYLGLQFAKYPAQLTKSLVTVKALGLDLKELDSIADSFLDFESSISKEFEAQLLTGKEINLAKARELFLNNDLAGAAIEISKQVGTSQEFLAQNRIAAEAQAAAFGMSRDQLAEMLKKQELLSKLGAKDTDNAQKQLQLGLAKYQNQKALTEAIGEEAYQNLVNSSTQEKIAAYIDKIKQSIVDFVERTGLIEKIEGFINKISDPENVKKVLILVRNTFADIADVVLSITRGILTAIDAVTFGFGVEESFQAKFEEWSKAAPGKIRAMGGNFEGIGVSNNAAAAGTAAAAAIPTSSPSSNEIKVINTVYLDQFTGKVMEATAKKSPGLSIDTNAIIQ